MSSELRWSTLDEALALGLEDLLYLNFEEIEDGRAPLAINWAAYRRFQSDGLSRLLLALVDQELVGYAHFFVQPTLHHRLTRWATNDLIWVDPAHRRGLLGIRMIREAERKLRSEGVQRIAYHPKAAFARGDPRANLGLVLSRLGYELAEQTYVRFLT